ncbi:hypothetical protein [Tardiphaga sp.]|uniref:hypothetical protein n=1 Tax=Tardiphaga sp. TaxID=1926292 RepID=UPI002626075C|nr:hypothetical protein [Tardiphaga sp.]MDB5618733.1 hypothetical protein [Tardiphaga sp.]
MAQTVDLTTQEREFAAACIDFVYEANPRAPRTYKIDGDQLKIPVDPQMREAFLDIGLKRLKKVLGLAVSHGAIEKVGLANLEVSLRNFDRKMSVVMT